MLFSIGYTVPLSQNNFLQDFLCYKPSISFGVSAPGTPITLLLLLRPCQHSQHSHFLVGDGKGGHVLYNCLIEYL